MSETPNTGTPPASAPEADQKKQTVRISLPPKPAGGPGVKLPASGAPAVAAAPAAPAAEAPKAADADQKKQTVRIGLPPKPAAPVAKPAAPATPAAAAPATAPAAPAVAKAPVTPAPAPVAPARPAAPTISPLDLGLAFATVVIGICVIVRLLFLVPAAS